MEYKLELVLNNGDRYDYGTYDTRDEATARAKFLLRANGGTWLARDDRFEITQEKGQ